MNKRRLLKLADLLQANAKNKKGVKFDLQGWGDAPEGVTLDCKTTACAVGLACISGTFNDLTFELRGMDDNIPVPVFGWYRGWDAVEKFFGLTDRQAQRLFDPDSYPKTKRIGAKGERAVAYRIRRMIAAA